MGPLEGVRVVELASEWTGPVGLLLAGMGAAVTVVEPPEGSPTRAWGPFMADEPGPDRSLWWRRENRGKEGVRLDLEGEADRAAFGRLLDGADVLVESEAAGRLAWLGELPALVWASVTPFGRGSDRADEAVTDLTLLAGAGPIWSNGYDDHTLPPMRGSEGQAAVLGGYPAVIGLLAALLARTKTGRGQLVDVSLHAALNVTTEGATYEWFTRGETVQRQTGRHAWVDQTQPIQFLARDGRHVHTGVPSVSRGGCQAVLDWLDETGGRDDFADAVVLQLGADGELPLADPQMQEEVVGILRACTAHIAARVDAEDFYRRGQARGFTVAVVRAAEDVLADPHLQARGAWEDVGEPTLGRTIRYPAAPVAFRGGRGPLGPSPL
jgi:benzylsuccinate CoA-transferase BbsE subunit